jgi:putative heme-binding domain-containing protein
VLGLLALAAAWSGGPASGGQNPSSEQPSAPRRVPWTTSRIRGSPEPPAPYAAERAFPRLTFNNPLLLVAMPGTGRLCVGEQPGKLYSFPESPDVPGADLLLDLTTELKSWDAGGPVKGVSAVYGLAFHPRFAENRSCYVCYVLDSKKQGEQLPEGSRVSRFRVTATDPPRIDPASETVLLTFLAGGHNGGDLHFGPDGFLYISTGDGTDPNPPDKFDTGQDLSDLLSSILRIDVDREEGGKPYAIPPDNPFVTTPGARPEIWAYGFRNPWRMSFDRATGDLWVGDVGWEQWEMVYRVRRGGNYGWSVMEGRQPVRPESRRGPTPILPPALEFPHTEAASITGGYVYHGDRLPELRGQYVCGDWMTGRLWATRFDGDKVLSHREIAQGPYRIVAFGEGHRHELYFVHYHENGTIHRLVPNPAAKRSIGAFPRKLSETGLFASTERHEPAPGVVPFAINAGQWADHATAERLVALPGESAVTIHDHRIPVPGTAFYSAEVFFPPDGVLARTFSLEMEVGRKETSRRIETQILHFDGDAWRGYSYRWNDTQTDADLVPAAGADLTLHVKDPAAPDGVREQTWHFPARAECLQCHNPWAGHTLAFTAPQLACKINGVDQLKSFQDLGLVVAGGKDPKRAVRVRKEAALVPPDDPGSDLARRTRSYLHANCSHCHQFGAGGTADIDLRAELPLGQTKTRGVRPAQGTFELHDAKIIAPGEPFRSVLLYRMAKLGPGRMPHIGSDVVDRRGLQLVHNWILGLADDEGRPGNAQARGGRANFWGLVAKDGLKPHYEELLRMLASPGGALGVAYALHVHLVPDSARAEVIAIGLARPEPAIRDLFEPFAPAGRRTKRLGNLIRPEQILSLAGDALRGKTLFFQSSGLQCASCHRIGGVGGALGPDLSDVGARYDRAAILESLLDPSRRIDPAYQTYLVETTDGRVFTGLLARRDDAEIVLKCVGDKEVRLPKGKVERLVPQQKSLMPDLLLRDLTASQAADLLEFLVAQKAARH